MRTENDGQISRLIDQIAIQEGMMENMTKEVDILSVTLDQSRQQAIELQQEISRLQFAASSLKTNSGPEVAQLKEQLKIEKQQALKQEQVHMDAIKKLMDQLSELSAELEKRSDYSELKQKYAAFLCSEFGDEDDASHSLEMMLQGKCKRLETEIVKLRQQHSDVDKRNAFLDAEIQKTRTTIQTLEQSIEQYEQMARSPSMSPEQSAVLDDNSSVRGSQVHSDDIITILTNQRERFKRRNNELERVHAS